MPIIIALLSSLFILFFHELGHYICAKLLKLNIEQISWSFKPIPRVHVTVIDVNIGTFKRILYLISGNIITVTLFSIYLLLGFSSNIVGYMFVVQIIFETNPFFSDYSSLVFFLSKKGQFRKIPQTFMSQDENFIDKLITDLRESYFLSLYWYLHFVCWGILIIILLRNFKLP